MRSSKLMTSSASTRDLIKKEAIIDINTNLKTEIP